MPFLASSLEKIPLRTRNPSYLRPAMWPPSPGRLKPEYIRLRNSNLTQVEAHLTDCCPWTRPLAGSSVGTCPSLTCVLDLPWRSSVNGSGGPPWRSTPTNSPWPVPSVPATRHPISPVPVSYACFPFPEDPGPTSLWTFFTDLPLSQGNTTILWVCI